MYMINMAVLYGHPVQPFMYNNIVCIYVFVAAKKTNTIGVRFYSDWLITD